jgi:hypothetical protein
MRYTLICWDTFPEIEYLIRCSLAAVFSPSRIESNFKRGETPFSYSSAVIARNAACLGLST